MQSITIISQFTVGKWPIGENPSPFLLTCLTDSSYLPTFPALLFSTTALQRANSLQSTTLSKYQSWRRKCQSSESWVLWGWVGVGVG